jgi:hypothetical protein
MFLWIYSLLNINLLEYNQISLKNINQNNQINQWLTQINPNIIINTVDSNFDIDNC